ncbi:MAG: endonuclease/exonuclease/phosphatase family protein [Pseudomonadota bacterium]
MRPFFACRCLSWLAFLACIGAVACARTPTPDPATVTVMTFNVENLFDTVDDPDRRDETYLPLSAKQTAAHRALCADVAVDVWRRECLEWDWNERVYATKLERIANAILQENSGRGPDVIVLQEVENRAVVAALRDRFMPDAGYRTLALIEGQDTRGIDVAILSRLPLDGSPTLHPGFFDDYPNGPRNDTRGILEASLRLPSGVTLTVFAVHFPAPFHPHIMREQAYTHLNRLADKVSAAHVVVAAGDFNTTEEENRAHGLYERFLYPAWEIAHENGCEDCPGTFFYRRDQVWNHLDLILWRRPASDGPSVRIDDVRLANQAPFQTSPAGTPQPFDLPEALGVSDHWPVVAEFSIGPR